MSGVCKTLACGEAVQPRCLSVVSWNATAFPKQIAKIELSYINATIGGQSIPFDSSRFVAIDALAMLIHCTENGRSIWTTLVGRTSDPSETFPKVLCETFAGTVRDSKVKLAACIT